MSDCPNTVVVDLREPEEQRAKLDPAFAWHDVSTLTDPPWIKRYARGQLVAAAFDVDYTPEEWAELQRRLQEKAPR